MFLPLLWFLLSGLLGNVVWEKKRIWNLIPFSLLGPNYSGFFLLVIFYCSLCIKHPNLFGGSEKLDVSWDKGLYDSNVLLAYRRPRPEWLAQQSFVVQVILSSLLFYLVHVKMKRLHLTVNWN